MGSALELLDFVLKMAVDLELVGLVRKKGGTDTEPV